MKQIYQKKNVLAFVFLLMLFSAFLVHVSVKASSKIDCWVKIGYPKLVSYEGHGIFRYKFKITLGTKYYLYTEADHHPYRFFIWDVYECDPVWGWSKTDHGMEIGEKWRWNWIWGTANSIKWIESNFLNGQTYQIRIEWVQYDPFRDYQYNLPAYGCATFTVRVLYQ